MPNRPRRTLNAPVAAVILSGVLLALGLAGIAVWMVCTALAVV